MIRIVGVKKSFGEKKILREINLNFPKGQTHVLLGSSGSGKSTLIRLMMGLIRADEGVIDIDGTVMSAQTQNELARKIGYVVQDGGLFPHLNIERNVTLVARTLRWQKSKIDSRCQELLSLVELDAALLKKFPHQVSGGQRQRVGLMRALMLDPAILFLDEPLGALDPVVRGVLQNQLKRIFNSVKKTVVIVTHDIGEAAFFGHTITLLSEGEVVQHGTFEDFLEKPASAFVTDFINAQKPPPQLKALL